MTVEVHKQFLSVKNIRDAIPTSELCSVCLIPIRVEPKPSRYQTCAKVPKRFGIQGSLSPRSGILMDLGPCVVIFVERLWKPRTPKFGYCAKPREPRTLKFGYHVKPRKPRSSKFGYHTNPGNPGPQKFVLSRNPGNLA